MRQLVEAITGRQTGPAASVRLFALFLTATFLVESLVMVCLPAISPARAPAIVSALIDATMLTLAVAPFVWVLFLRPVHRLHEARGRLLEGMVFAQEQERRRIALDLHDGLGQELTAVLLRLQVLESQTETPAMRDNVAAIKAGTTTALTNLRRLVRDTRPPVLESLGLAAALEKLLHDVNDASGIQTRLESRATSQARFPGQMEVALYRIVQEAVTNAVRHADCGSIEVSMDASGGVVELTVADDGGGFDAAGVEAGRGQPFGILGMRERASQYGGSIKFASRSGGGTVVTVRMPLPGDHVGREVAT